MIKPVAEFEMFPTYMTPEDYTAKTGKVCPPFDNRRQPKTWEDPAALKSARNSVVYDCALVTNELGGVISENGKPVLDVLVLSRFEAGTVNIPPNRASAPGEINPQYVSVPLKPLPAGWEFFLNFGGGVAVRDKEKYAEATVQFSAEDRRLLQAIAAAVGAK